eukprot:6939557-Prymnesium_polylepis.1
MAGASKWDTVHGQTLRCEGLRLGGLPPPYLLLTSSSPAYCPKRKLPRELPKTNFAPRTAQMILCPENWH